MNSLRAAAWAVCAAVSCTTAVCGDTAPQLLARARAAELGSDSVAPDPDEARRLYLEAADSGSVEAMSYAGFLLYGDGERERGVELMQRAAEAGEPRAANNLGYLAAWPSDGSEPDYARAQRWLGLAAAAGLATAQAQLADLIAAGLGSAPDTARAEALYAEAARRGVQDAQFKMIALKENDWKRLEPDSALRLGLRYYTQRAPAAGVVLFAVAALDSVPRALALLGDAYSRAQGVGYDHDKSLSLFVEAAVLGDPSAQFVIAELLDIFPDALDGRGLPVDCLDARWWYDRAAEAGVNDAAGAQRRLLQPD